MGPAGGQGQTACKMVSVLPEVQIPWLQYWHCFLPAAWLTILSAQLSDTGRERERGSVCVVLRSAWGRGPLVLGSYLRRV